ncbi:hypothetical protein GLOIN_2v1882688 [Rhizophagus clarus]|uniref:Uncharacterized protein n=1 Tax=Rhizophagus clarus TaxID=94130 RepID=A0A8H3M564_9GLOM|nr:hypothetical protein GLOIN_2v1882688 [Rhizophagus clarus]
METRNLSEIKKCSGYQKTRSIELFSGSNKTYSTCSICRNQKKAIHNSQKQKRKETEYENIDLLNKENKENGLSFERTLNIVMLNNNSPKNIAEGIIEQISDADNFHWKYV